MEVYTRRSSPDRTPCRGCQWDSSGGMLGVVVRPDHTCARLEPAAAVATRQRAHQLARMNRQTRSRSADPAAWRSRTINAEFKVY